MNKFQTARKWRILKIKYLKARYHKTKDYGFESHLESKEPKGREIRKTMKQIIDREW